MFMALFTGKLAPYMQIASNITYWDIEIIVQIWEVHKILGLYQITVWPNNNNRSYNFAGYE